MIMKKYRLKKKIINYAYVANPEDRLKTEDGKKHLIPPMECSNLHWVDYYGIPEWLLNEDKYFEPVEDRIELLRITKEGEYGLIKKANYSKFSYEECKLMEQSINLPQHLKDALLKGEFYTKGSMKIAYNSYPKVNSDFETWIKKLKIDQEI